MKKVRGIQSGPKLHWVGDGFPVRSLFSYDTHGRELSPFLLLDHAAPMAFEPASEPRGVGEHPHRGFETVTIVFAGEIEHRDSSGGGGKIGPGDVQWMTAASGVLHDEFHSRDFTRRGGLLEMVQLWVNLPAKQKMSTPGYQTLLDADIPVVELSGEAGRVRVIAGELDGRRGPAKTFTSMNVWDIRLIADRAVTVPIPEGDTLALVVLRGAIEVNDAEMAREGQLVLFESDGDEVRMKGIGDAVVLLLSGEPIDEPIVGYGPFVMNSEHEIRQAVVDFNSGGFGRMAP